MLGSKKEIISMGDPSVKPHEFTGNHTEPMEFKKWLDEGKEVNSRHRNTTKLRMGTFEGAVDFDIRTFRAFHKLLQNRYPKGQPVVMFCTRGIRCEKASVVMLNEDIRKFTKSMEGFSTTSKKPVEHWNGECFVFDRRVGVDGELNGDNI